MQSTLLRAICACEVNHDGKKPDRHGLDVTRIPSAAIGAILRTIESVAAEWPTLASDDDRAEVSRVLRAAVASAREAARGGADVRAVRAPARRTPLPRANAAPMTAEFFEALASGDFDAAKKIVDAK